MKRICKIGLLFSLIIVCLCFDAHANPDTELLRKRFIAEALAVRVDDERVQTLLDTFKDNSVWPGINYEDVSNTGFEHRVHLDNMLSLSRAYKKMDSRFKGNKQVKQTFSAAMDYWLAHDFICENWWHNQIGTPTTMVSILLIMDKDLTLQQIEKILVIVGRANLNASGARPSGDRIKIAGILAKAALFRRDIPLTEEVIKIIEGEIKFATGRGMQYDYSFHHREDRVNNTLSYGTGYADAFAEWAANVANTRYRFSDKSLQLLTDYYLDGICKQMVYARTTDPGVMNRDITRPGEGRNFGTATPERLLKASGYRKVELEEVIKVRRGEEFVTSSFAKFFWQTEHFVFQRPDFYTSVRMYSTRNDNMEVPYNGEGLMNHFRGDGTNYISLKGNEYNNLAPVYDWRKIPGATILQGKEMPPEKEIQKQGLTDFVGGVTDGIYGAAVFDFKSPHNPLSAHKSWFFFDKEYICLGAGINSQSNAEAATALNQCRLRGDVTIKGAKGKSVISKGDHSLEQVSWIHHDGIGYLFPAPRTVNLLNDAATGSWYRVNRQSSSSKEEIRSDVFKLWVSHGANAVNADYAYIVIPGAGASDMEAYAADPQIEILSNTPDLQAVNHKVLNLSYLVFYRSGELKVAGGLTVGLDSPGMVMVHCDGGGIREITVSDPSRRLGRLHLTVNGKEMVVELPQGVYAGESVTNKFNIK